MLQGRSGTRCPSYMKRGGRAHWRGRFGKASLPKKKWGLIRADLWDKGPCLGSQERFEGMICGVEGLDKVPEQDEGRGGVEEGIVPGFFGD